MSLLLSRAMPEESRFCFQIFISNLLDLSEQLDKQFLFYFNEGECASSKHQLNFSVSHALKEKFGNLICFEKGFVLSKNRGMHWVIMFSSFERIQNGED